MGIDDENTEESDEDGRLEEDDGLFDEPDPHKKFLRDPDPDFCSTDLDEDKPYYSSKIEYPNGCVLNISKWHDITWNRTYYAITPIEETPTEILDFTNHGINNGLARLLNYNLIATTEVEDALSDIFDRILRNEYNPPNLVLVYQRDTRSNVVFGNEKDSRRYIESPIDDADILKYEKVLDQAYQRHIEDLKGRALINDSTEETAEPIGVASGLDAQSHLLARERRERGIEEKFDTAGPSESEIDGFNDFWPE